MGRLYANTVFDVKAHLEILVHSALSILRSATTGWCRIARDSRPTCTCRRPAELPATGALPGLLAGYVAKWRVIVRVGLVHGPARPFGVATHSEGAASARRIEATRR